MKTDGSDADEKRKDDNQTIAGWLTKNQKGIESVLPAGTDFLRFARMTLQAIYNTPDLLNCSPASLTMAVREAASKGLEPDGEKACIIPYKGVATFQTMYQGELDLAYRTELYEIVTSREIRQNDDFDYHYGIPVAFLKHRPPLEGERGNVIGVWAGYKLKNGGFDYVVKSVAEIEEHKEKFAKGTARKDSAWNTNWLAMAKKTVLLMVLKYAPKSIERPSERRQYKPEEIQPAGQPEQLLKKLPEFTTEPIPEAEPEKIEQAEPTIPEVIESIPEKVEPVKPDFKKKAEKLVGKIVEQEETPQEETKEPEPKESLEDPGLF